jgi:type II secretory pathway pseudopilin PulG
MEIAIVLSILASIAAVVLLVWLVQTARRKREP